MDGVDGVDCDSRCWGAFAFCLRVSQAITILLYSTAAMSSLLQAVFLSLPQSADRCPHLNPQTLGYLAPSRRPRRADAMPTLDRS